MTKEHKLYLKKLKMRNLAIRLLQLGVLILMLGLWELSARLEWVDPFITSSPSRIVKKVILLYSEKELFNHLSASLWETVIGFLLSTVIGTIIALILWWNETIRRVMEPYLVVLNALPKVALGPLIIIWVGVGKEAIVVMALLICMIITIISMLTGFTSIEKEKIQLLQSMKANKFQIFTKLVLPGNIPTLLSVLKINVGLAWVGTIMGEYIVSREGIGYQLIIGQQFFDLDLIMTYIVLLSILATAMYLIVALLDKVVRRFF